MSTSRLDRYVAGLNATLNDKIALAEKYFHRGLVLDAGSGAGFVSYALANSNPNLVVIGIDQNPEMFHLAHKTHKSQYNNLLFYTGDITQRISESNTLDGIFNFSSLHHVYSFNGYSEEAVLTCLRSEIDNLKVGGTLLIRDFILPPKSGFVLLELPNNDGDNSTNPLTCSTAALFEKFSKQYRLLSKSRVGFGCVLDKTLPNGWNRYYVRRRFANEFILKKDYREDWDTEVQEEYCFFDKRQFETILQVMGMRVLESTEVVNPWIVENRFAGKFVMRELNGEIVSRIPTNYVIAAVKEK